MTEERELSDGNIIDLVSGFKWWYLEIQSQGYQYFIRK